MRLLLIRHGESVDNVAGLYAGSRDSPLTNHGVLQAKRLGAHLGGGCLVRHIFTSNLQRAYKTAEAIADAQQQRAAQTPVDSSRLGSDDGGEGHRPCVEQLRELREKDFGSDEGKKFGTRAAGKRNSGALLSDAETRKAMRARAERFLAVYFEPYLTDLSPLPDDKDVIVIVAHGIILNTLVRALLARYPIPGDGYRPVSPTGNSEFSVAWSNTGVLQGQLRVCPAAAESAASPSTSPGQAAVADSRPRLGPFVIEFTNNVDHLRGLRKTRGGIGSSKFDSRQKTMDTFFAPAAKKRKHDGSV
ncbi:2,3-bisphosphoglycerate-dependent phosphoglycerate mutase [Microdochium nivale]|nr:2,3-bisphosphoglycerate-dependent phosphoglycerate mutase [Microdochium nivale]